MDKLGKVTIVFQHPNDWKGRAIIFIDGLDMTFDIAKVINLKLDKKNHIKLDWCYSSKNYGTDLKKMILKKYEVEEVNIFETDF